MKRVMLLVLVGAFLLGAGCTIVTPADRVVIHQNYLNAQAMNAKVQAVAVPTPNQWAAVQAWWNSEENCWMWLDDWANGRTPTTPQVISRAVTTAAEPVLAVPTK
jgi:hypothetical protein